MAVDDVGGERAQRSATPRVVQVRSTNIVQKYAGRQSIVLGVVLAVAATLSCIFNIVDLAVGLTPAVRFTWGAVGHGFWTGIAVRRVACRHTSGRCMGAFVGFQISGSETKTETSLA